MTRMTSTASPFRSFVSPAIAATLASIAACGNSDKASPPPPRESVDALKPPAPQDAGASRRDLGAFSSVQARFDRDCPPTLPRRRAAEGIPNLKIDEYGRSCTQVTRGEGTGTGAVRRTISLDHVNNAIARAPESGREHIQAVDIDYTWTARTPRTRLAPECTTIAHEVADYLRDLTGMSSERAILVAAAIRLHHGQRIRFVIMDREVCARADDTPYFSRDSLPEDERGEGFCGAGVDDCHLVQQMDTPPVDVDLDALTLDGGTLGAGGQDGQR